MWKTIASSGTTTEKVLPTLLCVMDGWPVQKMYTSDGDNKDVFSLAVSFHKWPLLVRRLLLQCLSILSPAATYLPASGTGLTPGLGAGLRGTRPAAPPVSPLASPLYAQALPLDIECCL